MPRKNSVLTGQTRKMVFDVHNFIKKETVEVVDNLKQIKKQTNDAIDKLFRHINMSLTNLGWIEKRTEASNKPILTQTRKDLIQIKEETADAIKTEMNKFDGIIKKISQNQKRTAAATNTSVATVRRISTQIPDNSELAPIFKTPAKKRPRAKPITGIDNFHQGVIRRCIHNFPQTNKEVLTLKKLAQKLQENLIFHGSERSLRRVILNLGFRWKRTNNKHRVLIESSNIRLQRIEYIEKLKKFRQEGRPVIYSDESYVDPLNSMPKANTDETTKGQKYKQSIAKGQRVVIIHAGSEAGFIPNALLTFKTGIKSGDYHDNINYENYEKWLRMQLMPNLPPNSVVVVNNASYHNNIALSSNAKKVDMQAWLTEKGIEYGETLLKPQLYKLILANQECFRPCSIDSILAEQNHVVLRLPQHHRDLMPIEMAWSIIKQYVSSKIVKWNLNNVTELIKEKVDLMGKADWEIISKKIQTIEDEYARSDYVVDMMTEQFNIRVNDDSSDSDSSDNDNSNGNSSDNDEEINEQMITSDDDVKNYLYIDIPCKSESATNSST